MIFVDTSALFSIYNRTDPHHTKAVNIAKRLQDVQEEQLTSNIIMSEMLTIISMRLGRKEAVRFGKSVITNALRILFIDEPLHQKAWEIFQTIGDKDVSFFDCTSFALMQTKGINQAFSFDKDFEKFGFTLYL